MNHDEAVREMIEVGRRLDGLGFLPATDGNLSVRLSSREIVATVSGVRKGRLTPRDFAVIDPDGAPLRGGTRASSEIQMHLRIYRERADATAVVHAHPPTATGFAVAGIPLQQCVLPEVVATIGAVPLAPYATPSTGELPDAITPLLKEYDALLLANHGVVTFGPTLFQAANRMETVEQFARILFVARTLGQVNLLTPQQVERLNEIRHRYGSEGKAPACETCRNFVPGPSPEIPPVAGQPGPAAAQPAPQPGAAQPASSPAGVPIPAEVVDRVVQEVLRLIKSRAR